MTTKLIYKSYQSALPIAVVIQIIGALFYFITAVYIVRDQVYEEVSYTMMISLRLKSTKKLMSTMIIML